VTAHPDHPVGFRSGWDRLHRGVNYFGGPRRGRYLFSHVRPGWSGGWSLPCWYVDRRRRRPRRGRNRLVRVVRAGRGYALGGGARVWGIPLGTVWVWTRLPGVFQGNLETLLSHVGYRLAGRGERRVKQVVLPLLGLTRRTPGVVGASVRVAGRFGRRQRADRARYSWGRPGRTHLGTFLADGTSEATLRFGRVGLKLAVNYGG